MAKKGVPIVVRRIELAQIGNKTGEAFEKLNLEGR
jgi:hypothetical protein